MVSLLLSPCGLDKKCPVGTFWTKMTRCLQYSLKLSAAARKTWRQKIQVYFFKRLDMGCKKNGTGYSPWYVTTPGNCVALVLSGRWWSVDVSSFLWISDVCKHVSNGHMQNFRDDIISKITVIIVTSCGYILYHNNIIIWIAIVSYEIWKSSPIIGLFVVLLLAYLTVIPIVDISKGHVAKHQHMDLSMNDVAPPFNGGCPPNNFKMKQLGVSSICG